jgi:hypothetical protein
MTSLILDHVAKAFLYKGVSMERKISSRLAKKVSLAAICFVAGSASFGLREN